MNRPQEILNQVRKETDSIILFTSLTGKDSILLTYYCAEIFNHVVCVYEYVVKGLQHVLKHQIYFENKYPHLKYIHVPHYCLGSWIKGGYMGIAQEKSQKNYTLAQLDEMIRVKVGIDWSAYGMRMNDSLNRRLQLGGYEQNAICRATRKVYPLSELTTKEVLGLIELNRLPRPIKYNDRPSQGQDIDDINYLLYLRDNYPNDLLITFETFPATRQLIYEYERKTAAT